MNNGLKRFVAFTFFILSVFIGFSPICTAKSHFRVPDLPQEAMLNVQRLKASEPGDVFVVLKNGLTLLVHPMENSEVVSAQIFVRAGSIHEGKYMGSGLSHYLEHVVSGGSTRSFTEQEATERLERMGAQTNAYTSYDRTVYYINTAAQNWQGALDLLLSYVSECNLEPAEIQREKPVIQQEMRMGDNSPQRQLWRSFMEAAYLVHPVRNPIIGFEEIFINQDRETLLEYYMDRYRPDNMVVAVAGGVNPAQVVKFVGEKTAGFQKRNAPPISLPQEPPQLNVRRHEKELPFTRLTQVMVGYPSVTLHHADLHALDVLGFLLGQGRSSRLYARLKDQENRVLSVGASNWTPSYVTGRFLISMSLAPHYWPDVLQSLDEEIEKFKTEPVSNEELEKAKKQAAADHIFGRETASSLASSLASSFHDTGDPYFNDLYLENIGKVTPEQILNAARTYLDPARRTVVVLHPPRAKDKDLADVDVDVDVDTDTPYSEVGVHQGENGLQLLIKENASLPMVTIHLYGLGGIYLEDGYKPGISAFTSSLLTDGTKNRTKMEIARAIEEVGGSIVSRSDNNTFRVSIRVLKEDIELALDILADVIQNPIFPQEEIEKLRESTLLAIKNLDANWQNEVMRLFRQNYFQESPYRHDRLGTQESIESITREDVLEFYEMMINPRRSVLAVYGDMDTAQTLEWINRKFSTWKGHDRPLPEFRLETANIRENKIVELRNDKTTSGLFVGTNGMDINDEIMPVLDVLDSVLSGTGYPGGRLFKSLRGGEEDLVYTVWSFPFYGKRAGFYGVLTQTTLANLDRVQNIILKKIEELVQTPLDNDELKKAKEQLIAMRKLNMERLDTRAQSAAVNSVLGLGWDYDDGYPEKIRRVTAEQIQELAGKLFTDTLIVRTIPENPVEILVVPPPMSDVHSAR